MFFFTEILSPYPLVLKIFLAFSQGYTTFELLKSLGPLAGQLAKGEQLVFKLLLQVQVQVQV